MRLMLLSKVIYIFRQKLDLSVFIHSRLDKKRCQTHTFVQSGLFFAQIAHMSSLRP